MRITTNFNQMSISLNQKMSNNPEPEDNTNHVKYLENQLNLARREINNLRQQLKTLNHVHRKECDDINKKLENWQCLECRNRQQSFDDNDAAAIDNRNNTEFTFKYIGVISTNFPEKRGTPRQPGICPEMIAKLTLNNNVFTNPSHALEGLQEYSHLWILFHFHKNDSTHIRAKITPPRLNGIRTGVFATRSPHRPSPIGMSLVKIDRIMENCIYFSGVDMVDQTPVIDIKPYIPQYDSPSSSNSHYESSTRGSLGDLTNIPSSSRVDRRVMDGEENGRSDHILGAVSTGRGSGENSNSRPNLDELLYIRSSSRIGEREAPDGEEEESPNPSIQIVPSTAAVTAPTNTEEQEESIRVPSWIDQPPVHALTVTFKDRALAQLQQLGVEGQEKKIIIANILREDPRSMYLRERWGSHCYVFRIAELFVSCKFDDSAHSVTVYQVFQNSTSPECDE